MIKATTLFLALAATLPTAAHAAGANSTIAASARPLSATLSPQQRGEAIATFVRRWGSYVSSTYGLDVHTWSSRMVQQFATGDATNIQRALSRTTFEGALAELDGAGYKLSDDKALTLLARNVNPTLLGDTSNDMVFTPVPPCRIVDTRLAGGPISATTSRAFGVWGFSTYTFQGGSSTDCGLLSESPEAAVLNVTVVTPSVAGYATVYPANAASRPNISSLNYTAGAVVNNTVIAPLGTVSGRDVQIFSVAQANYVVDIVGYYDAPHATPLQATTATANTTIATGTDGAVFYASCPTGFTKTGGFCYGAESHANAFLLETGANACVFRNGTGADLSITAVTQCARVPGR